MAQNLDAGPIIIDEDELTRPTRPDQINQKHSLFVPQQALTSITESHFVECSFN